MPGLAIIYYCESLPELTIMFAYYLPDLIIFCQIFTRMDYILQRITSIVHKLQNFHGIDFNLPKVYQNWWLNIYQSFTRIDHDLANFARIDHNLQTVIRIDHILPKFAWINHNFPNVSRIDPNLIRIHHNLLNFTKMLLKFYQTFTRIHHN